MLLELNSFRNISLKESHRKCHPLSLHTARPSVHAVKMPLMRQWHQSSYGPSHCLAPLGPQEINLLSPQPLGDIKSSVLCPRGGVIFVFSFLGSQHRRAVLCWDSLNSRLVPPSPPSFLQRAVAALASESLGSSNQTTQAQLTSVAVGGVPRGQVSLPWFSGLNG